MDRTQGRRGRRRVAILGLLAGAFLLLASAVAAPGAQAAPGDPDVTFSGDGRQTTGVGGQATGVALQGDGKIVAVGYGVGLARYNPDGSLDMGFAGDGTQATAFVPNAVALTPLGRIVVAGYVGPGPSQTNDFVLARYLGA